MVEYFSIFPLKRVHPCYKATPAKGHLSYQARFQIHCDGKILLNFPLLIRPLFSWQKDWPYQKWTTLLVISII
jgi:hypothetical protein